MQCIVLSLSDYMLTAELDNLIHFIVEVFHKIRLNQLYHTNVLYWDSYASTDNVESDGMAPIEQCNIATQFVIIFLGIFPMANSNFKAFKVSGDYCS